MPSTARAPRIKQYDHIPEDSRTVSEEAYSNGIQFNVKYVGSMDINRPSSRVEIVAAMRRVRFEYKSKGVKKRNVTLTVGTSGMKTTLRKRRKKRVPRPHLKGQKSTNVMSNASKKMYKEVECVLLNHPIYRIFYVSHDSQDVKIFSYIARETSSNVFTCCVYKAKSKSQALKIVRTVGQAFEVCQTNKQPSTEALNQSKEELKGTPKRKEGAQDGLSKESDGASAQKPRNSQPISQSSIPSQSPSLNVEKLEDGGELEQCFSASKVSEARIASGHQEPYNPNEEKIREEMKKSDDSSLHTKKSTSSTLSTNYLGEEFSSSAPLRLSSSQHENQLLRSKLEQQTQQTQAALAQIVLLRDQLQAETNARIEAQTRTHQLLIHNKELLDHMQGLVRHVQELEGKITHPSSSHPSTPLPQMLEVRRSLEEMESLRLQNTALIETLLYENLRSNWFLHPPPSHSNMGLALSVPGSGQNSSNVPNPMPGSPYYCATPTVGISPNAAAATSSIFANNKVVTPQELEEPFNSYSSIDYASSRLRPPDCNTRASSSSPNSGISNSHTGGKFIQPIQLVTSSCAENTSSGGGGSIPSNSPMSSSYLASPMFNASRLSSSPQNVLPSPVSPGMGPRAPTFIGRSVSERLPHHKTELTNVVQRNLWTRHTTK